MGRLLVTVAGLCAVAASSTSVPAEDAKLIAAGVVEGFLSDSSHLRRCVRDAVTELRTLDVAVERLGKNDTLDKLRGLRALSEAFHELPDALQDCKAVRSDVEMLASALSQIHSPTEFVFRVGRNLIVNHKDIYAEVQAALADWTARKFEGFGVQVGEALRRLAVGSADFVAASPEQLFSEFIAANRVEYATEEERGTRFSAFVRNLEHIDRLQLVDQGDAVYSHLSPFADIDPDEFSKRHGLKAADWVQPAATVDGLDTAAVPKSFDWRTKGAVNSIKDQAQCGSCWAFATVANIEGVAFVATGKLVSLSEQELVDCDKSTGDEGCDGGLPSNAYKDMIKSGLGLETEGDYPYKARDGKCRAAKSSEVAFIKGWSAVSKDEDQIAAALVKYGPLAIGINAATMQFYFGGIAKPWRFLCSPSRLDHGVALVGFGEDEAKGTKYWTIRNSWGLSWGERGYYRVVRGVGACGLNNMVTTATGVHLGPSSGPSSDSFVV